MVQANSTVEARDIAGLENPLQVISFFTRLGYATDLERNEKSPEVLRNSLHSRSDLRNKIVGVTQVAHQQDEAHFRLDIYLYELQKITRTIRREIVADMKKLPVNCLLLILADRDFHELEFVYLDRAEKTDQANQFRLTSIWEDDFDDLTASPTEPFIRVQRVDRRHPSQMMAKMLNGLRLQTVDVLAQATFLSTAFDNAETREVFFNNRSLFSNYYLKERLPDNSEWEDAASSARAGVFTQIYNALHALYRSGASEHYAGLRKQAMREQLFDPALQALGFTAAKPSAAAGYDYLFTVAQQDGSETRVVCQVYPWGRLLDDPLTFLAPEEAERDENPAENPVVTLVAQIKETGAQWGILTNGKLWRLYSAKARSRSTNYYEIDLEDVFAIERRDADKASKAFLYFWLFFRRTAFVVKPAPDHTTPLCFLDSVLTGSELYARDLSASLKERIFDEIFPKLAQGFVDYALAKRLLRADLLLLHEEERNRELAPYFTGTLNFLYRLLFLLYAESRELLPVHDERYSKQSLEALKQEISGIAGEYAGDVRAKRLQQGYEAGEDACRLYDHLWQLFVAIDKGNPDLNVPAYHGDIFLTALPEDRPTIALDEDEKIALFLQTQKIPDRSLALGLDLLARDVDPVKKESTARDADKLSFIDYRSLGVRQLGSIYEGLLEFKLRIATEDMVIVENKVLPANGQTPVYTRGDVYIENDLHERKATGSYYTPDYIVKYIIEETVGPILRARLDTQRNDRLKKNLDAYQQKVLQEKRLHKAPEELQRELQKFAQSHEAFVDEFFNLKVLDPAMGSGHFLVDAVDYITDYMVERLRDWLPTPLDVSLQNIRQAIQAEAEAQGISIDSSLLTEINLLKRQVLKRCIFGVDLNPMAVRLAKLGLWIDSLTQGAPFSFLDHHLRCGNSLLGVTMEFMSRPPASNLLTHNLYGVLASVKGFEKISRSADETAETLAASRVQYHDALAWLEPYQQLANLWLSECYGNEGARNALETFGREIVEGKVTPAQFATVKDKSKHKKLTFGESDLRQISVVDLLARAQQLAARTGSEGRNFFHWDLEFPEVFFDATGLRPASTRGFDAIIGNPPYVRQEGLGVDKDAFADLYKPVFSSIADLYTYFIARGGHELLHNEARFGMITSNKFMRANYGAGLRAFLVRGDQMKLEKLVDFGDLPVFGNVVTYPIIILSQKAARNNATIEYGRVKDLTFLKDDSGVASLDEAVQSALNKMPESAFSGTNWSLADVNIQAILDKLNQNTASLQRSFGDIIRRGIVTGYNEAFVIDQRTRDQLIDADPKSADIIKPFLAGENIKRYAYEFDEQYIIFTRRGIDITQYKAIEQYLSQYRQQLEPRSQNWDERKQGKWPGRKPGPYKWYEIQDNIAYFADFEKPKILFPDIADGCRFAFSTEGEFSGNTTYFLCSDDLFLLSLLNSSLIEFFYRSKTAVYRGGYLRFFTQYIVETPIRRIKSITPKNERSDLRKKSQQICQRFLETGEQQEILAFIEQLLARQPEAADVVRDLLEILVETMLSLNEARQTSERRFLSFIESTFKIQQQPDPKTGKMGLDALSSKTTLFEYAGDYQKGTLVKPLDEMQGVLRKNRKRCLLYEDSFKQALRELEVEYEQSKACLEPLKRQLKATDGIIDQIVYRLYGLTEEERALVEK